MRRFLLFTSFCMCLFMSGQTILNEGDVAITAYDTPTDDFTFVILVDIDAGTEIYFTDEEADGDNTIGLGEGHVLFTAPSAIPAGSVLSYQTNASNLFTTVSNSYAPGNSGDGLIAYQGTSVGNVDRFLFAVGEDSGDVGSFPAGFSSIVLFGNDDGEYSGTRSDSKTNLFNALTNVSNWTTSGTGITPFDLSSFTFPTSGNPAPSITNILLTPVAPTSSDAVTISADVMDADGVASVNLNYGFSSGNLTNSVAMSAVGMSNGYTVNIPAQANGTQVFYEIVATDMNAMPASSTSIEDSYTVTDPDPAGLQIDAVDTEYLIDFDNTVANVNNDAFRANGVVSNPAVGQLDSDAFAFEDFDGGNSDFGDDNTLGDYVRGISDGVENSGGIYAFEVASMDFALGVQPTSSDFNPGKILFRFTNNTGGTLSDLYLSYDIYYLNNASRAQRVVFMHGSDANNLSPVAGSAIDSEAAASPTTPWQRNSIVLNVPVSINDGDTYVLAWQRTDLGSSGSSDELALDNIRVVANPSTTLLNVSGDVETLTLLGDANVSNPLNIYDSLTLGNGAGLITNDMLTFKSSNGRSAVVREITGGAFVLGEVIVEQFYPAQRAFRFISSPVTMSGSSTIYDQWQQGGLNPGDNGYQPGVGIQITGGSAADGFDQSGTNNPSMFGFSDNATQSWDAFTSSTIGTNSRRLFAGNPLRVLVRGDRSVSLTTPNASATDTKLVTTGELRTGDHGIAYINLSTAGQFAFVGNPYQSQVDIGATLAESLSQGFKNAMYVWNPQAGSQGAYRLYDYGTSTSTPSDSEVTGVIQPGQAFFLEVEQPSAMLSPALQFKESHKVNGSYTTSTFSTPQASLFLDVYKANETTARDGFKIFMDAAYNDAVETNDLRKINNIDENIGVAHPSATLIVEKRSMPQDGTIQPLTINRFATGTYQFNFSVNGLSALHTYLYDEHTQSYTELTSGVNQLSLSFDSNIAASIAATRFSIVFSNVTLSNDDVAFAKAITLYPNPVVGNTLFLSGIDHDQLSSLSLWNTQGQYLGDLSYESIGSNLVEVNIDPTISRGVYFIKIDNRSVRFIKE